MAIEKICAFISSTSDLKAERAAVKEVCNMLKIEPFLYEEVPANSAAPDNLLRKEIGRSEIFVGLLGGRYGSLYPPQNERSVVEFEFDEARNRQPVYLTAVFSKALPDDGIDEPQQKFRKRIGDIRGIWIRPFDSVDTLKEEVRNSIVQWLADFYIKYKRAEEPAVAKDHKRILGIAAVLAAVAALIAFIFLAVLPIGASMDTVAIAIGCFAVGILLCIVVVKFLL